MYHTYITKYNLYDLSYNSIKDEDLIKYGK